MADRHEYSSPSIRSVMQVPQGDTDFMRLNSDNNAQCNELNANLKLSWTGDLDSLKLFVEKYIDFNGTWKSPGDERKSYSNGDTTIIWWRKIKKLQFSGKEANRIKQQCCNILMGKVLTDSMSGTQDENDASRRENASRSKNNVLPAFGKPQNQCLCSQTAIDLDGIKLDIEILQSRTDALQSLADVQECCIPSSYNANKVELLMQEFTEEKGKLKKIEGDLTDIKRMVYDRKGEQDLKSTDKVQIPVDVTLSNTNKLIQTSNETDAAALTLVPIIPYINEVVEADYIHNLPNIPFHQNNSSTRSVMEQRMQIKSYRKRQSKAYTHYRLNEQLQSYRAKHKEIFMNNNSKVPEAPARNTQINRSHIPTKRISESNIHRKSNKVPSHRRVETDNLIRWKDRMAFSAKNATKESGHHPSNRPPFHRRPTNHVPAMYRSHRINSPPPYQIHQLMKLPSYQPRRLTISPSYQPPYRNQPPLHHPASSQRSKEWLDYLDIVHQVTRLL